MPLLTYIENYLRMMKISQHIAVLFLLLTLSASDSISQEYFEFNKNSDLKVLADSSSQESNLKQELHKTYYSNGVIKEELYYKNGKLHGFVKIYDQLGYLIESSRYKDGVLDGTMRKYSKGQFINEVVYQDGKLVRSTPQIKGNSKPAISTKSEETVDLNTTEFKYLTYFLKLKRQIEAEWKYPKKSADRGEKGKLLLIFTINRNGTLEEVELINSSGYINLDDEAIRSIRFAAPFAPFPEYWGELERLRIRATFEYTGSTIF